MVNGLDARGVVCGGNTTDQAQSVAHWIFPICISCTYEYVHRTLGRGVGSGSVNAREVVCKCNGPCAVGSSSDFEPWGPWFDPRHMRRLLWPSESHISTAQCVYSVHYFLNSKKLARGLYHGPSVKKIKKNTRVSFAAKATFLI